MTPTPFRFAVNGVLEEIDANPLAWNVHRMRTMHPQSPHREADDIWVRFNAIENLDAQKPGAFFEAHDSAWYPEVANMPQLREMIEATAGTVGASIIGGVLVTRIPPGKQIYWHADNGWHADVHRKFLILLRGNAQQSFEFKDEQLHAEPGDCFEFQNGHPHRVLNPTSEERISLIICLRGFQ